MFYEIAKGGCWWDAAARTRINGRERMDNYRDLLKEREANPCTPEQQRGVDVAERTP